MISDDKMSREYSMTITSEMTLLMFDGDVDDWPHRCHPYSEKYLQRLEVASTDFLQPNKIAA